MGIFKCQIQEVFEDLRDSMMEISHNSYALVQVKLDTTYKVDL